MNHRNMHHRSGWLLQTGFLVLLFACGYLALRVAAWLLGFLADHWWELSLLAVALGVITVYLRVAARRRRQAMWQQHRLRDRL